MLRFYSHQQGDDVTVHSSITGDEDWSFDSVDSDRIRIGARLTHKVNERNSLYGGPPTSTNSAATRRLTTTAAARRTPA